MGSINHPGVRAPRRPYPVRLVMVPSVMGCLIWARGSTTVRLGSGDSRGFPMWLLVKLL